MGQVRISRAVRKKLQGSRIARLATVSDGGSPHVVPICFVLVDSMFYTAIDRKPKQTSADRLTRVRNIKARGQAALLFDEYSEDWSRLWFVLVRGRAQLMRTGAERRRALRMLRKKYRQYAEGMLPENALVIRIVPLSVIAWGRI